MPIEKYHPSICGVIPVTVLGNYKPTSVRAKLLEHCTHLCLYTDRKCLKLLLGWSISAHRPLTCSASLHLFSHAAPLSSNGMCISAVWDQSVVNRALLREPVCVFMFHVPTCWPPKSRWETRPVSRKTVRRSGEGWGTSSGNYPHKFLVGIFQWKCSILKSFSSPIWLSGLSPTYSPGKFLYTVFSCWTSVERQKQKKEILHKLML